MKARPDGFEITRPGVTRPLVPVVAGQTEAAARTAIGKFNGKISHLPAVDLGARAIQGLGGAVLNLIMLAEDRGDQGWRGARRRGRGQARGAQPEGELRPDRSRRNVEHHHDGGDDVEHEAVHAEQMRDPPAHAAELARGEHVDDPRVRFGGWKSINPGSRACRTVGIKRRHRPR